ncbi:MAG TPA: arylsulfatase [Gemmataceae bacterium]
MAHRFAPLAAAALTAALLGPAAPAPAADPPRRPNVVLIMTDDQGYGDFGATGNKVIETPHLDAMAGRGAWMTSFYVCPVCSPTRACLMTGRYNYRTRVLDTYIGRSMMDPEEVTLAEVLKQAGYATGIFGKWHLGDCYPMRPNDQGFDEALVHRGGGLAQPSEPRENRRRYTDPILFRNGEQVQTRGYCTDVYFGAATEFIEKTHKAGRNFFVYLPTNAPHGPFHDVPEDLYRHYLGKSGELAALAKGAPKKAKRGAEVDTLARIAAMITNVDQNVGRLFEKLDALGVTNDTLVIFLTDNGPNTARYVGPFRGRKGDVHEGGVRTVLWAHWPARLKAGTRRDEPAAHIDVMPTVLEACGVPPPKGVKLDGRSFLGLLTGETESRPERPIVIQSHRGDVPVRYHHFMIRDGRWKLLHPSGFGRETFEGEPRFELYDLAEDPGETKNLIAEKPEVAARLKRAYEQWFDDVSNTRPDNYAPPRIHVGTRHENPTVLTRQDWRGGTWEPNSVGHWKLRVAEAGVYDFRLLFDAGNGEESAVIRISFPTGGAETGLNSVPAGSTSCVLRGIELPAGDADLRAVLKRDGKERGVYQVEVTKR